MPAGAAEAAAADVDCRTDDAGVEVERLSEAEFSALDAAVHVAEVRRAHGVFRVDLVLEKQARFRVHAHPTLPPPLAAALRPLALQGTQVLFSLARYDDVLAVLRRFAPPDAIRALPDELVRAVRRVVERAAVEAVGCSTALVQALIGEKLWSRLLDFQRDGVVSAIRMGSRVLLADDMGMGKTVSALAIAEYHRATAKLEAEHESVETPSTGRLHPQGVTSAVLILCPATLREPWVSAVKKWLPGVHPKAVHCLSSSNDAKRLFVARARGQRDLWDQQVEVAFVVCSYDVLPRLLHELRTNDETQEAGPQSTAADVESEAGSWSWTPASIPTELSMFRLVIADECHTLRHIGTARARACLPVILSAEYRVLVSGTPVMSRPAELFALLQAVLAEGPTSVAFMSPTAYEERYCGGSARVGKGASNLFELNTLLSYFMVRRLKAEVELNLPSKNRTHCILELSEDRLHFFKQKAAELDAMNSQLVDSATADLQVNEIRERQKSMYAMLFSATATAKVPGIVTRLRQLLGAGDARSPKVAVFGFHRQVLDAVESLCTREKLRYIRMDGSTSPSVRGQLAEVYQTDTSVRVAILSIKVASAGLTLTAADHVLFAELDWVPANLTQAEDRAHRIGRTGVLTVEYAVAHGTLDDRLWPAVRRKLGIVGKVVDRKPSDSGKLDPENASLRLATRSAAVQATCMAASDDLSWNAEGNADVLDMSSALPSIGVSNTGESLRSENTSSFSEVTHPPPKRRRSSALSQTEAV